MRSNKLLFVLSIVLISLLAVSVVSAANTDDLSESTLSAASSDSEILAVDNSANQDDLVTEDTTAPELNVTTQDTPYNERAKVQVTLTSNASRPTVSIYVDGDNVKNLSLFMKGKGTYNIPAKTYDVGSHTVEVTYDDPDYGLICKSVILNITQVTPIVSVNDVTAYVGETVVVPFTVTDNKGKGMAGKANVSIYLPDKILSQIVEFNDTSKFNFDLSSLFNGTSFNMSGLFNGSSMNISAMFNGSSFNISGLFNGSTFNVSGLMNGSTLNLTGLLNGTGLNLTSMFNGTGLNISGLFNGSGFNLSGLLNGTGLNMTGLFNGTDFSSYFNGTDFSSCFNITSFDFSSIFSSSGDSSSSSSDSSSSNALRAAESDEAADSDRPKFDISSLTNGTGLSRNSSSNFNLSDFNISALLDGLGIDLTKIFGGGATEHNATFDYPFEPGVYKMTVEFIGDGNYASVTNDTAKLTIIGNDTEESNATDSSIEKHAEAKTLRATGNPVVMMLLAVLAIVGFSFRKGN